MSNAIAALLQKYYSEKLFNFQPNNKCFALSNNMTSKHLLPFFGCHSCVHNSTLHLFTDFYFWCLIVTIRNCTFCCKWLYVCKHFEFRNVVWKVFFSPFVALETGFAPGWCVHLKFCHVFIAYKQKLSEQNRHSSFSKRVWMFVVHLFSSCIGWAINRVVISEIKLGVKIFCTK